MTENAGVINKTWLADFSSARAAAGRASWYDSSVRSVYCVTEGPGLPVKFGLSSRPRKRLPMFQYSTWRQIFVCWVSPGRALHEAAIKHLLAGSRLHGEWYLDPDDRFKCLPDGLEAFIEGLARDLGYPPYRNQPKPRQPPLVMADFAALQRAARPSVLTKEIERRAE